MIKKLYEKILRNTSPFLLKRDGYLKALDDVEREMSGRVVNGKLTAVLTKEQLTLLRTHAKMGISKEGS